MLADLKATFASPPAYLRRALKRSEDFWHRRRATPCATLSLTQLLRGVALSVTAAGVGMQHHVVSTGDPGTLHFRPERIECVSLQSEDALCSACLPSLRCASLSASLDSRSLLCKGMAAGS